MNYEIAFIWALFTTISIETITAGGLKLIFDRRFFSDLSLKKLICTVPFASLLSLPYFWFLYPAFFRGSTYVVLSEISAVIIESVFYRLFLTKKIKLAILLSLITNAISFFIGNIIL